MVEVRDLIGIPFISHGRSKEGFDCWGLAIEVLRRGGKKLPDVVSYTGTGYGENRRTAPEIIAAFEEGCKHRDIDEPKELCLIKFAMDGKNVTHVGVYLGHGDFIHCIEGFGVCVQRLDKCKGLVKGYYEVL